jgi:penicillin-binding protein 1A
MSVASAEVPAQARAARARWRPAFGAAFRCFGFGLLCLFALFLYARSTLPQLEAPVQIDIRFADGGSLAKRSLTDDLRMSGPYVSIDELPAHVWQAVVATEDRRFFRHFGIDALGIVRAVGRNLGSRSLQQGGSTITQQLARNISLSGKKTWKRKFIELFYALALESRDAKQKILQAYLNRIYWGADSYGISAAAILYFGKHPKDLTLAEAAMLAVMIRAPERLSPLRHVDANRRRAELVLQAMVRENFVTERVAEAARRSLPGVTVTTDPAEREYIADLVLVELRDLQRDGRVADARNLIMTTTIDRPTQLRAESTALSALKHQATGAKVDSVSLLAMTPDGMIRAMVAGRDYRKSRFNLAIKARRQPGSAFKPFVYLAALEAGMAADSLVLDAPDPTKPWFPENANGRYSGLPVTLAEGLSGSINSVAARLGYMVTPARVISVAQRLGVSSPIPDNPTIALGSSELSMLELTAAYAAFANGGFKVSPQLVSDVASSGKIIFQRQRPEGVRVISARNVGMMNGKLEEVILRGTGRRAVIPGQEVAGKTGTTQNYRDAWFVGYSAQLVAAIWVGNLEGEPMNHVVGGQLPAEIWASFMRAALNGRVAAPLPGRGENRFVWTN